MYSLYCWSISIALKGPELAGDDVMVPAEAAEVSLLSSVSSVLQQPFASGGAASPKSPEAESGEQMEI